MINPEILNMPIDRDVLEHHGILGQQWGVTNGPPYPLKDGDHSRAEKRAMRKNARQERIAMRKAKRQQKHELKQRRKAEKAEAKRKEILRKGDAKAISKLKGNISNDEYLEVFRRLENERRLDELTSSQVRELSTKINAAKNIISNVKTASDAAIDFYNNGADIYNTIIEAKGLNKRKMLPIKRTKRKEEAKKKKNQNRDEDDDD